MQLHDYHHNDFSPYFSHWVCLLFAQGVLKKSMSRKLGLDQAFLTLIFFFFVKTQRHSAVIFAIGFVCG